MHKAMFKSLIFVSDMISLTNLVEKYFWKIPKILFMDLKIGKNATIFFFCEHFQILQKCSTVIADFPFYDVCNVTRNTAIIFTYLSDLWWNSFCSMLSTNWLTRRGVDMIVPPIWVISFIPAITSIKFTAWDRSWTVQIIIQSPPWHLKSAHAFATFSESNWPRFCVPTMIFR
jgi:hypothetical protein